MLRKITTFAHIPYELGTKHCGPNLCFSMTFCIFSLYKQITATLQMEISGKLLHISLRDGSGRNLVTTTKRQFGGP